jgi:hypothetical protein
MRSRYNKTTPKAGRRARNQAFAIYFRKAGNINSIPTSGL